MGCRTHQKDKYEYKPGKQAHYKGSPVSEDGQRAHTPSRSAQDIMAVRLRQAADLLP